MRKKLCEGAGSSRQRFNVVCIPGFKCKALVMVLTVG